MKLWEKEILTDRGHVKKMIERGIGHNFSSVIENTRESLRKGSMVDNPEKGKPAKKLCIYYDHVLDEYFKIPFTEMDTWVLVYSTIPLNPKEIRTFKKQGLL